MAKIETADDEHSFYLPQKDGSLFSPQDKTTVQRGHMIYQVKDHGLAVCLYSAGIDLRKDPPYVSVDVGTRERPNVITTYNFMPSDEEGKLKTGKCIEAWTRDMDFIETLATLPESDPMHIFGACMATWKNSLKFREHHMNDTPFVAYLTRKDGRAAHYLVKRDSRKDKIAQSRGMRRVIKTFTNLKTDEAKNKKSRQ